MIGSDRSSVASRASGNSPELAEIISEIVYSVIGSDRSSVASRATGNSPELAEIISEIVYLGDHLCRSGYCPGYGPYLDASGLYNTARMSAGGCWGGRWVFYCASLSVCASGVRVDRGGADVGAHDSRFPKGAKAGAPPFAFTPGSALLLPPALALTPLGVLAAPRRVRP